MDLVFTESEVDSNIFLQGWRWNTNDAPVLCRLLVPDRKEELIKVAKHAVRYLKGTVEYGLNYDTNKKINLEGYVDSDWAGSAIDRKISLGCSFSMGSGVISWFSRKQSCMELSTVEETYVATCSAIWEVVCFFWKLIFDLIDMNCIFLWCTKDKWSSSLWSRLRSLERGSSSIVSEIGFLSINPSKARRFLRCR